MLKLLLNGADITSHIEDGSIRVSRSLSDYSRASFTLYGEEVNVTQGQTVKIEFDSTDYFNGYIQNTEKETDETGAVFVDISCVGNEYNLYNITTRLQRFEDENLGDIIEKIAEDNAFGITVEADIDFTPSSYVVRYNDLYELLRRTQVDLGYFYVADVDGNVNVALLNRLGTRSVPSTTIQNIAVNGSIREQEEDGVKVNTLVVQGGRVPTNTDITETITTKSAQVVYTLVNDFAERPTATIDSNTATVGIEGEDHLDDVDLLWSPSEKTIQRKTITAGNTITLSAPVFQTIRTKVTDTTFLTEDNNAEIQSEVINDNIHTRIEARQYALYRIAEIRRRANSGLFRTNVFIGQTFTPLYLGDRIGQNIVEAMDVSFVGREKCVIDYRHTSKIDRTNDILIKLYRRELDRYALLDDEIINNISGDERVVVRDFVSSADTNTHRDRLEIRDSLEVREFMATHIQGRLDLTAVDVTQRDIGGIRRDILIFPMGLDNDAVGLDTVELSTS